MRSGLLIAAAIVLLSLGIVEAQDARRTQVDAILGCILTQHRTVTALAGLGLKPGEIAEVVVNFGSIVSLSPSDREDVQVLFLSRDRMRGWLGLGSYRVGSITIAPDGYWLARSGAGWNASEGNGGAFTYPEIASHVDRMSRTPPVRVQLMPRPSPNCRLQALDTSSQDLARVWDTEHVSSPISPLVDHAEVKRRIGIGAARRIRIADGARRLFIALSVGDLGDLRTSAGLFEIDGTGKTLAAGAAGATVGMEIDSSQLTANMQTGSSDLMLLEPAGDKFRVVQIFPAQQEVK